MSNLNIYVFDFDCTITYRNFAYFWLKPDEIFKQKYANIKPTIIDELSFKFNNNMLVDISDINLFNDIIFGSDERIVYLDRLFNNLSHKGRLVISSRGDPNKIFKCLQYNSLSKYFTQDNIFGYKHNKTNLIKEFLNNNSKVFYIDDNHEEHNELLKNLNLITTTDNLSIYSYKSDKPNYIFCHSLKYESNGISNQLINRIIKNI